MQQSELEVAIGNRYLSGYGYGIGVGAGRRIGVGLGVGIGTGLGLGLRISLAVGCSPRHGVVGRLAMKFGMLVACQRTDHPDCPRQGEER